MTIPSRTLCAALSLVFCGCLVLATRSVRADIMFFDNLASFQASSSTTVEVTFDPYSNTDVEIYIPPNPSLVFGSVKFTPIDSFPWAPNLIVASLPHFNVPNTSNALTASGNENIDMAFSTAPTAVGFDTYTNAYGPPKVSVYDTLGNLIGTYTLTQSPSSLGFVGIVSSVPIGSVNWLADQGNLQNTGFDNIRVGFSTIPEPGSLSLLAMMMIPGLSLVRRQRRVR